MTDKITTVLWDVDGTLLDFIAAEKAAIRKLFKEYDLGECTDEMLARYSKINRTYWVKLENGEMTKPEILVGRFRDFFVSEGLDPSIASAFNEKYQDRLGDADSIVYCDDSLPVSGENHLHQVRLPCWYNHRDLWCIPDHKQTSPAPR